MMHEFDRTDRVSDQILRILGEIFERGLKDPRIGFITLTGVEVARDFSSARVYFTAGEDAHVEEIMTGLKAASGYLRKRLGDELTLRLTPDLHFHYDESVDRGFRMEALLKEIAGDRDESE